MKKCYEKPEIAIMVLSLDDAIRTSDQWVDEKDGDVGKDWYWGEIYG